MSLQLSIIIRQYQCYDQQKSGRLLVEECLRISKVGFKLCSQDTTLYMEQSLLLRREKTEIHIQQITVNMHRDFRLLRKQTDLLPTI